MRKYITINESSKINNRISKIELQIILRFLFGVLCEPIKTLIETFEKKDEKKRKEKKKKRKEKEKKRQYHPHLCSLLLEWTICVDCVLPFRVYQRFPKLTLLEASLACLQESTHLHFEVGPLATFCPIPSQLRQFSHDHLNRRQKWVPQCFRTILKRKRWEKMNENHQIVRNVSRAVWWSPVRQCPTQWNECCGNQQFQHWILQKKRRKKKEQSEIMKKKSDWNDV